MTAFVQTALKHNKMIYKSLYKVNCIKITETKCLVCYTIIYVQSLTASTQRATVSFQYVE